MPKKKPTKRRPDGAEWKEAELLYASGDWTQDAIAQKLGISSNAVYKHMAKEKIVKGSMREQLSGEIQKTIAERMAQTTDDLMEVVLKDKVLTVKTSHGLKVLMSKLLKEAADARKPISSVAGDLKTIETAQKILGMGYDNISKTLGLDKTNPEDEDLAELTFRNLTQANIEEIRQKQTEELAIMNGQMPDDENPLDDLVDESEEAFEEDE